MRTRNDICFQKIIILLIISLFSQIAYTQQANECGTQFDEKDLVNILHFANNDILTEILNETGYFEKLQQKSLSINYSGIDALFCIPVKFWIYCDDNWTNVAYTETKAIGLLRVVNENFSINNTFIRFYMGCDISYINNTDYNNSITTDEGFENLISDNYMQRALNIHIVQRCSPNKGRFPWKNNKFSLMVSSTFNSPDTAVIQNSVTHEIGHTFGLFHTHEGRNNNDNNGDVTFKCFQEAQSRDQETGWYCCPEFFELTCEINGDYLCDTEASPRNLSNDCLDCNYIGTEEDLWGNVFTPQARNFMAYAPAGCRTEFTQQQIAVMYSNIISYMVFYYNYGFRPWYNRNNLSFFGTLNAGEDIEIVSAENIIAPKSGNVFTALNGSSIRLKAQNSIKLQAGTSIKKGAKFSAKISEITNCDFLYPYGKNLELNEVSIFQDSEQICSNEKVQNIIQNGRKRMVDRIQTTNNQKLSYINELNAKCYQHFLITPNPTTGKFTISTDFIFNSSTFLEIYDITSTLIIKTQITESNTEIDMSSFNPGIYFVKILTENYTETKKILIQ